MPNSRSAKKRVRQIHKRTLRNRVRKARLKKAIKAFHAVIEKGDPAAVREELRRVHKAVDKAGDKGIIHGNAVNRRKSRFACLAQEAAQPSAPAVDASGAEDAAPPPETPAES